MSSIERSTNSPEQPEETQEGVVDANAGRECTIAQDRPSTAQESRHVTPLLPCQCGCGRPLDSPGRGEARKYATPACRTRAWRRRRDPCAGAPSTTPALHGGQDEGRLA